MLTALSTRAKTLSTTTSSSCRGCRSMPSSTSPHASFDRRLLIWLFVGIVGAPLLWLMTMQTGYVLAYQACDERSTSWVAVPTFIAVVIAAAITLTSLRSHRRASGHRL